MLLHWQASPATGPGSLGESEKQHLQQQLQDSNASPSIVPCSGSTAPSQPLPESDRAATNAHPYNPPGFSTPQPRVFQSCYASGHDTGFPSKWCRPAAETDAQTVTTAELSRSERMQSSTKARTRLGVPPRGPEAPAAALKAANACHHLHERAGWSTCS